MDQNKQLDILTNNYTNDLKKRRLSKLSTAYFIVLQFVFCADYGFSSQFKLFNLKILTFIEIVVIVTLELISIALKIRHECPWAVGVLDLLLVTEFGASSVILLLKPRPITLFSFLKQYQRIDRKMGQRGRSLGPQLIFWGSVCVGMTFYITMWIIAPNEFSLYVSNAYARIRVPDMFVLITPVVFSCAIYIAHRHLLELNRHLQCESRCNVAFYQEIYKANYDAVVTIMKSFSLVYTLSSATLPRALIIVSLRIASAQKERHFQKVDHVLVVLIIFTLATMTLVHMLPAFLAKLLISDTDAIDLSLQNRLLRAPDPLEEYRIRRFIDFVRGHPLKFWLLLDFPLDPNLVAGLFSFLVTYVILVFQITHVY